MIFDRFKSIFEDAKVELASSYPICTGEKEILFFYSTGPNDENSFRIKYVESAYARDIISGEITQIDLGDAEELIQNCIGEVIRPEIIGAEAYKLNKDYYILYEQYFDEISAGKKNEELKAALIRILWQLVPDSGMKNLYLHFGRGFFE